MTPVALDAGRTSRMDGGTQSPLFEDLRSDPPARRPAEDTVPTSLPTGPREAGHEPHPRSGGDRLTLEASLERIWEGLLAAGAAECPICGGALEWSRHGGACSGCDSRIH